MRVLGVCAAGRGISPAMAGLFARVMKDEQAFRVQSQCWTTGTSAAEFRCLCDKIKTVVLAGVYA